MEEGFCKVGSSAVPWDGEVFQLQMWDAYRNYKGIRAPSGLIAKTLPASNFAKPAGVENGGAGKVEVRLKWSKGGATTAVSYRIYRGTSASNLSRVKSDVTKERFVDPSLDRGRTYYYAISGVDSAGKESPRSDPIAVKT